MIYLENELNQFETYTYNLSLYMIRYDNVQNVEKNINTENSILIANNATNAKYNISGLEQQLIVGQNKVRSSFSNIFDLEIFESNGATLLNTLYSAAKELGLQSHRKAYYLLTIEFVGRLPDGRPKKFTPTFNYPVIIDQLDFKINETGSTYAIKAIEVNAMGYSYLENVFKNQITIEAETVGEFFELLRYKVETNNKTILEVTDGQLFQDTYEFEFAEDTEDWKKWRFQQIDEPINYQGYNIVGTPPNAKLQITISNGSKFDDIVGVVLALTKEYKQVPTDEGGNAFFKGNGPGEPSTEKMDKFPVFYKVLTKIEPQQFDPLRGDFQKNITFTIKKYIVPNAVIDTDSYYASITDRAVQSTRVQKLNDLKLLRKRYDYIFTGLNTEVLNLELNFNQLYYSITPFGSGWYGDPNMQTNTDGQDAANMIQRLAESKKKAISAASDVRQLSAGIKQTKANISVLNGDSIIGFDPRLASLNDKLSGLATQFLSAESTLYSANAELQNATTEYLSTYNVESDDIAHRLTFAPDVINDSDNYGPESDRTGGSFQFGAIKANIENTSDMNVIEIQVRGDPYWLGAPVTYDRVNTGGNKGDLADYTLGGNFFFLKANFPISDVDANGQRKPSPDYQFSGLYIIDSVINTYRDGQFTQFLHAILDVGTNIPTAISILDAQGQAESGSKLIKKVGDLAQAQEDARRILSDAINFRRL